MWCIAVLIMNAIAWPILDHYRIDALLLFCLVLACGGLPSGKKAIYTLPTNFWTRAKPWLGRTHAQAQLQALVGRMSAALSAVYAPR